MQIRIAKSQREDKTAYVAVRAGEMWLRRRPLRSAQPAALCRRHARRAHRAPTAAAHLTDTEKAPTAVGAFPLPCTRLDKQGETP